MSEPIIEQIRSNIVTAIAGVKTDSSYPLNLTVESVAPRGNKTADLTVVVEQGEDVLLDENDPMAAVGRDTYHADFFCFAYVSTPNKTESYDAKCNRVAASIRKAVMADVSRGNLAEWTRIQTSAFFTNEMGAIAGIMVPFKVRFFTKVNDPFTSQ
jgi:hypothetical protein